MALLSSRVFSVWVGIFFCWVSSNALAVDEVTFLTAEQAFAPRITLEDHHLRVNWHIEDGYYLYRHGFKVEKKSQEGGVTALKFDISAGKKKYDSFFKRNVETYHHSVALISEEIPDTKKNFDIIVTSQGCADTGLCFPPTHYYFTIDEHGNVSAKTNSSAVIKRDATVTSPIQNQTYKSPKENSKKGLLVTLFGALLGGLILNLMPCVFPVLSLKALSFSSGHDSKTALRQHGWSYTFGVVVSFIVAAAFILGARSAGQSLGWGFQLQHPAFISLMVYLFFVMGLSLSGALEFGGSFMGVGQQLTSGHTLKSSFFTGVLAALVASPCTAPFMATALGVALTQSTPVSLLIFVTLGFGMALPFLALSYSPSLSRWLPRPGAWMNKFKQALSFPLYFTVLWLLWVLSHQTNSETVILTLMGMVLIVFSLWLMGFSTDKRYLRIVRNTIAIAAIVPAFWIASESAHRSSGADANIERYTSERLNTLRENGKPVFVDLTADWCLTCKVNEKIALTPELKNHLKSNGVTLLVGDWTNKDPEITKLLKQHNRSGIPLYLMYPAGDGEPELLPQLLTVGIVESAMTRALL